MHSESSIPKKLEGDDLLVALKQQVEFYFSPQNLPTDVYLRSQMNSRHFCKIDTIASFNKVKALTDDKTLLLQAIKQSKSLVLDETETMVGPNLKVERTTLILRDIPSTTKKEDIRKIFEDSFCGKVKSIRPDVGDTWFVTFENQDACTATAMYLVGKKFKGKPIRCRIKSENPFRSLFCGSYNLNPPIGPQAQGGWKPGHIHPPGQISSSGTGVFFPKPSYPPFSQPSYPFPKSGPADQNSRHRKSKRGKPKNSTYRGKQNQKHSEQQVSQVTESPRTSMPIVNKAKKVFITYQTPCLKYTREQMAEIVRKFSREGFSKPKSLSKNGTSPVIADRPAIDSQLLEPMPVMYPASPSPLFAAQPHHSSMPFLDLRDTASSNPGRGGTIAPNRKSEEKIKKGRTKKPGQKKYAKKPKPKPRKAKKD